MDVDINPAFDEAFDGHFTKAVLFAYMKVAERGHLEKNIITAEEVLEDLWKANNDAYLQFSRDELLDEISVRVALVGRR